MSTLGKNHRGLALAMIVLTVSAWMAAAAAAIGAEPARFDVPLRNPAFTERADANGVPAGWSAYGSGGKNTQLAVVDIAGGRALRIIDGDPTAEIGVVQTFALRGSQTYRASAKVLALPNAASDGAYLQLRFLPSHEFVQTSLRPRSAEKFAEVSVTGAAPPGTTQGMIYLYTHRAPTPKLLVTGVRLVGGLPPPPLPAPQPVPPQYTKLKDLHEQIPLVKEGRAAAVIVVPDGGKYAAAAERIQRAVEQKTGVRLPIVSDQSPQAAVPLCENLIVLGNRSTNRAIRTLYDRFYCLVDLKYPGPEGYVLRSVHDPFGNGRGVLIVGGSDAVGVSAGGNTLAALISEKAAAKGELSLGWTMFTRLGKGVKPPTDVRQFETWEASKGYGSVGYFGWCSISKLMAMYYMTGNESCAREFVRLAFPDEKAIKDIESLDDEKIENKHDPLAGFYHYNAHMAILFWDLIEESPVFSDAERLKITNAFARQLNHRKDEGVYGLTQPPGSVSSRHGQWSAISLYCLGRYFQKNYPHPVWAQCVRGGELAFHSLHEHASIYGETDNLFWYSTGIAPVLTYMTLTGDRKPLENGVLGELLRGQEILASGRVPDWALGYAPLDLLNKAAYLTGDGRWITYRRRTGVDTDVFRLGQSFWPDDTILPKQPDDLAGKWSIHRLPFSDWEVRSSGIPWQQSYYFGSYRSAAGAGGDFVLLDGFNGASRNPYHTFDVLELRLDGRTILQGYHNQVLTSADGMVEPAVAMDAALLHSDVLGHSAFAVGEVPQSAFCNWRRTLALRERSYAIVVDDLAFRTDSRNMKASTTWQTPGGRWDSARQAIRMAGAPVEWELRPCDVLDVHSSGDVVTMDWTGPVRKGEHRVAFSLIGPTPFAAPSDVACLRLGDRAAAMKLPEPALAVAGEHGQTHGELVVLTAHHLFGHGLTRAGVDGLLIASDAPVDIDWNFDGLLHVVAAKPANLQLSLGSTDAVQLDGRPANVERAGEVYRLALPAGRHVLRGVSATAATQKALATALDRLLAQAARGRGEALAAARGVSRPGLPPLSVKLRAQVGGEVAAMIQMPSSAGPLLCVAQGNTIHKIDLAGRTIRTLQTDGRIRVLRWWDEPQLLLAGCVDEKVIAFDAEGRRRWVFTSQMDPAVYEAAKTYWFKSAPGHEGIHGLFTGEFDGGKSRCFVGSACTLEILDTQGGLVKRTPIFWGPCWKFLLTPGPKDSRNLLVSQWHNGSDELVTVNSRTLRDSGRGYYYVPAGHTFVGGWDSQNRTAIRHEDLDGGGRKEIVTAINGTWNRVSVYSEDGKPLYNAQFGPGASSEPRAQMRDMDLSDLDGDGRKEIVVGTDEGLVVALNCRCEKLWSTRLPGPGPKPGAPRSLRCVQPTSSKRPWILVGCDDGTVTVLDERGTPIRQAKVEGRPTHIEIVATPAGPLAILATDKGHVTGFAAE